MIFTSVTYIIFLAIQLLLFLFISKRQWHNLVLLVSGYVFYGWVHPWFCLLILTSTVVDYHCGLSIEEKPHHKKWYLRLSILTNLGLLGFFKYFNFFIENANELLLMAGVENALPALNIFLPVGISFYTFQTLSYTVDVYKGRIPPCKDFIDFALYVSFFPQLVAGPIERAERLLPQIRRKRKLKLKKLYSGFGLVVWGMFKKMVIADNVALYVNQIYLLESPSLLLLTIGTIGFAIQIYADFSAYTDIARGTSRMLGFELIENFKNPYIAISPSDFWRRWHISFSTWIRDYLYIPLGGSRVSTQWQFFWVVVITMGISGLWHGAAWNFIAWGVYHGVILFVYHLLGLGGKWKPTVAWQWVLSWSVMICITLFGWALFRTSSMEWLMDNLMNAPLYKNFNDLLISLYIGLLMAFYSLFFVVKHYLKPIAQRNLYIGAFLLGLCIAGTVILGVEGGQSFIYFQF